ncbi:MAG: hypothetical protein L0241_16065 [Planctomycetia bacterium]|nr:hypothetical protein [Planctomycetia bacterium]
MRNQVDYSTDAVLQLNQFVAAANDPDEVERAAERIDYCLAWYDPRNDPFNTVDCGTVEGPGLLSVPHHTALRITVAPLRMYFEVDDTARPVIMTVVRVEWVLSVADPNTP